MFSAVSDSCDNKPRSYIYLQWRLFGGRSHVEPKCRNNSHSIISGQCEDDSYTCGRRTPVLGGLDKSATLVAMYRLSEDYHVVSEPRCYTHPRRQRLDRKRDTNYCTCQHIPKCICLYKRVSECKVSFVSRYQREGIRIGQSLMACIDCPWHSAI